MLALHSRQAIEIVFDRGYDGEPARQLLTIGTYVLGIDADQQHLDRFANDAEAGEANMDESEFRVSAVGQIQNSGLLAKAAN